MQSSKRLRQQQIAPSVPEWLKVGDRIIENPGQLSQRCGTVVSFGHCNHSEHLYPVVVWDSGVRSFTASDLIDVEKLAEEQQIALPLC
jgi:hypothetical protein